MLPHQFKTLLLDYRDSWSTQSGAALKRDRRRAAAFYYLIPIIPAVVFAVWHVKLTNVTPYLTALSVFTALLFGLLILVFNTAVTLRKEGSNLANAHGVTQTIADLRATVSYSIAVAIVLVLVLTIGSSLMVVDPLPKTASANSPAPTPYLPWGWIPPLVYIAVHLLLNVAKILERVRTAFNYISR